MKDNLCKKNFSHAYESFLSVVEDYGMDARMRDGVLIGFSGGPDSVLLLHLLLFYQKKSPFKILAVHVHHGIRGESADRDAAFAQSMCESLNVEFILRSVDVPSLAKEKRIGIEEAARIARYNCFDEIISSRNDVSSIVLGHNATDNLETVIFHLLRGCGTGGLGGIPTVRDGILRPLIALSKAEILSALQENDIPFILDETNQDTAYTRNYIRHEILPRLSDISSAPEVSVRRVCRNLICDNDYIEAQADVAYRAVNDETAPKAELAAMHPAVLSRVLQRWGKKNGSTLEQSHVEKLIGLICAKDRFSYDLPGRVRFLCEDGACRFIREAPCSTEKQDFFVKIFPEIPVELQNGLLVISQSGSYNISSNIYNFSIKANLRSAIIKGDLFLRHRREGDCYFYGGITHKLKKLFNDKKIPLQKRESLPILCDEKGIVWVPGFGVRDDGGCDDHALTVEFFY